MARQNVASGRSSFTACVATVVVTILLLSAAPEPSCARRPKKKSKWAAGAARPPPRPPPIEDRRASEQLQRGKQLAAQGDLRGALSFIDQAADSSDAVVASKAHAKAGGLLLASGQGSAAVGRYEAAVALRPGYTNARINLAHCHLQLGQITAGLTVINALVHDEPEQPHGHRIRGHLLEAQGRDPRAAQAAFRAALARSPEDLDSAQSLALSLFKMETSTREVRCRPPMLCMLPTPPTLCARVDVLRSSACALRCDW